MYDIIQGYYGIAVGKAQQTAKTEIEKLKVGIIYCLVFFSEENNFLFVLVVGIKIGRCC